jgi:ABC-type multidrug transport system fused ATPase/permease subunit
LDDDNAPKEVQEVTSEDVQDKSPNHPTSRFDLNSMVSEEGSNFSAGERQLLALCRALVKQSRVIVMDGAFHCENRDRVTDCH